MEMQKHAMLVVKEINRFHQPRSNSSDCRRLSLYPQQKKCQWAYPNEVGESKMISFMGFLHILMASQECGGASWLDLAGNGCSPQPPFSLLVLQYLYSAASMLSVHAMHTNSLLPGLIHSKCRHMMSTVMMATDLMNQSNCGKGDSSAPTICYWTTVRDYMLTHVISCAISCEVSEQGTGH